MENERRTPTQSAAQQLAELRFVRLLPWKRFDCKSVEITLEAPSPSSAATNATVIMHFGMQFSGSASILQPWIERDERKPVRFKAMENWQNWKRNSTGIVADFPTLLVLEVESFVHCRCEGVVNQP